MSTLGREKRCFLSTTWTLFSVLAIASLSSTARAQVAVTSSNDIAVAQEVYDDDSGTDVSSTGEVMINESQIAADTGISNGYINIANSTGGWVVQNLPVVSGVPYIGTDINMGTPDGTNEVGNNLQLSVDVSAQPLQTFTPTAPTAFNIAGQEQDSNQGEGANPTTPLTPPSIKNLNFNPNGLTRSISQLSMPNVQSADNQCGPAAIANGLTWLALNKGLNIPDPNVPGRGATAGTAINPNNPRSNGGATYNTGTVVVPNGPNSSVQTYTQGPSVSVPTQPAPWGSYVTNETPGASLVGQLDLTMNRTNYQRAQWFYFGFNSNLQMWTAGDQNQGTTPQQQLDGTEKYLGSPTVNDAASVVIDTQGVPVDTNAGITNNDMGGTVTPDFIFNEMSAGHVVKLGYTGHAVDAIATGSVEGVPWVLELSDLAQTSQGDPNDTILNNYLPFGIANSLSIPLFSFIDTSGASPVLVGFSSSATLNDAIAIRVVPEPASLGLICGITMLALRRPRRERQLA